VICCIGCEWHHNLHRTRYTVCALNYTSFTHSYDTQCAHWVILHSHTPTIHSVRIELYFLHTLLRCTVCALSYTSFTHSWADLWIFRTVLWTSKSSEHGGFRQPSTAKFFYGLRALKLTPWTWHSPQITYITHHITSVVHIRRHSKMAP